MARLTSRCVPGEEFAMTTDYKWGSLEPLLVAAGCAPSGDNTQPWRFLVDPSGERIALRLDETRDPSPMNTGQRMARIGVGAALENLLCAATGCGWDVVTEPAEPPDLAVVHLERRAGAGAVPAVINARVTNRRPYDGRPVPPEVLEQLAGRTAIVDGVETYWITDHQRLSEAAAVIGDADALMFGVPAMRRAFLANVRFDAPADAVVDQGLSLGSLELSRADRLALQVMRRVPDMILKHAGIGRIFVAKAQLLIGSGSGLCLVTAPDASEATDLSVGRAMQRAWLMLSELGLAAQPMTSLPVLENALNSKDPALLAAIGPDRVRALAQRFRALMPEIGDGRLAFMLRFGYAPAPSGRTGRLPLAEVAVRSETHEPSV
jgi:nitroreductase